jgi:hypothetical protein
LAELLPEGARFDDILLKGFRAERFFSSIRILASTRIGFRQPAFGCPLEKFHKMLSLFRCNLSFSVP